MRVLLITYILALHAFPLALVVVKKDVHRRIRNEVLRSVPEQQRETLLLSEEVYRSSLRDEGKEVEVGSVMFDIISVRDSAGIIVVSCLRDNAETAITLAIGQMRRAALSKDARVVSIMAPLLVFAGAATHAADVLSITNYTSQTQCTERRALAMLQHSPAIPTPPPEC